MMRQRLANETWGAGAIAKAAFEVSRADREGLVDGVLVDFRHPNIPAGEWAARPNWHIWPAGPTQCGFALPSATTYALTTILEDGEAPNPRFCANPGDRITVVQAVPAVTPEGREFDHLHDKVIRLADLVLTRPNGEQVYSPHPLPFYGVTQLREGPLHDAYDRLVARVLAEHGNPDTTAFEDKKILGVGFMDEWRSPHSMSMDQRALYHAGEAERALAKLVAILEPLDDECDRPMAKLREFARQLALAGFFQAKHELRTAQSEASRVRQGAARGRSQAKANDNRFEFARDIWRDEPGLTLSGLATQVIEQLYNAGGELLAHSTIVESLQRAINRGEIDIPTESPHHPQNKG